MKNERTAIRLKQIMKERHLRQVDILEKCKPFCEKYKVKLGRNDLSQYVSGKVEPGQEKLTILGLALNVSEAWLMGFDVPMGRNGENATKEETDKIMKYYKMLNDLGKETAIEQVRLLTLDEKYTKSEKVDSVIRDPEADYLVPNAAHERTGVEIKEEERLDDEDMLD